MQQAHLREHIDLIARHEQDFYKRRTRMEWASDAIAVFAASLSFVALHLVVFAAWIAVNTLNMTSRWHF